MDTNENTIFLFQSKLYLIENIPCYYSEHAGIWDPAYANASFVAPRPPSCSSSCRVPSLSRLPDCFLSFLSPLSSRSCPVFGYKNLKPLVWPLAGSRCFPVAPECAPFNRHCLASRVAGSAHLIVLRAVSLTFWPHIPGNALCLRYARIRDFATGALITNVSSSIGFGFVSAFVDEHPPTGGPPVLWLFGSACNRCPHPKAGPQGCVSPRTVQWWRATDATLTNFTTGVAAGTAPTYNVEVARVTSSPQQQAAVGLPPHNYVMILEIKPTLFLLNNAVDGDLSSGWFPIPGVNNDFGCPSGGPSIRFSPLDQYYYAIEGGTHVELVRTRDFQTW